MACGSYCFKILRAGTDCSKTPGVAMLALMADIRSPDASTTCSRFQRSAATIRMEISSKRVISKLMVHTRHNPQILSDTSAFVNLEGFSLDKQRQWPVTYCDLGGMAGGNFTNYGVLGVSTLFLLNQQGMVLKKTAMVD